jgi:hypothetical protein
MLKHKDVLKFEGLGWIDYELFRGYSQLSIEINSIKMVCSYLLIQNNFLPRTKYNIVFYLHSK